MTPLRHKVGGGARWVAVTEVDATNGFDFPSGSANASLSWEIAYRRFAMCDPAVTAKIKKTFKMSRKCEMAS